MIIVYLFFDNNNKFSGQPIHRNGFYYSIMACGMNKYRILIVDDDKDILSLLENILWDKYELICSSDPREALDHIEDYDPDLCIIDIMMPSMDGRDIVRQIRQKPLFAKTPIVFLSVLNERQIIIDAYNAGGDLFLTKPFTPRRFHNSLQAFLKQKGLPIKNKRLSIDQLQKKQEIKAATPPEKISKDKTPVPVEKPKFQVPPQAVQAQPTSPPAPPQPQAPPQKAKEPITPVPENNIKSRPEVETPFPWILSKATRRVCTTPRILVAINDEDILELVHASIGKKYELFSVRNGLELLRESDLLEPDLFIVDVIIPLLSGYQVCQMLKRSDFFSETPIILISDKTSKKDAEYAKKIGVNVFLPKPFEFAELEYIIASIVQAPGFSIRPKIHTYEEILTVKEKEMERQEGKIHRETKNIMRDFIRQHHSPKK